MVLNQSADSSSLATNFSVPLNSPAKCLHYLISPRAPLGCVPLRILPGTAMVHSSHLKGLLGLEGVPTPARLAAATWNWYTMFSFRSWICRINKMVLINFGLGLQRKVTMTVVENMSTLLSVPEDGRVINYLNMIIILAFPLINDGAHTSDLSTLKLQPLFPIDRHFGSQGGNGYCLKITLVCLVLWSKFT